MNKQNRKTAFTLLELSVVTLMIAILIAGILAGKLLVYKSNLKSSQSLTRSSPIISIPDLTLWLETTLDESLGNSSGVTGSLSENNEVASWNDISGNGIRVTQNTAADRPIYIEKGINNLPTVRFNGSNVMYSTTGPIDAGNKKFTIVAVWKSLSLPTCVLIEQKGLLSVVGAHASIWLNFSNVRYSGFESDTSSIGSIVINKPYIAIVIMNDLDPSKNINGYLNSNSVVELNSTLGISNIGNAIFSIAGRVDSAAYSKYDICNVEVSEVMIFNRNLNPYEVQIINSYLSKKYNITLS